MEPPLGLPRHSETVSEARPSIALAITIDQIVFRFGRIQEAGHFEGILNFGPDVLDMRGVL